MLRRTAMKESYHHADRTIIAELALHGSFYQIPDWLYFRRDHPWGRAAGPRAAEPLRDMDPRRANRLRHPAVRLYGEYIWAYIRAIRRAPLSPADRRECYRYLAEWFVSRARPGAVQPPDPVGTTLPSIPIDSIVPGREVKLS